MRFITRALPIFGLLMMFSLTGISQHANGTCGTNDLHPLTVERYQENIDVLRSGAVLPRTGAITYVPIKYILGARSNGTGRVEETALLDMHCKLNQMYADQDVQFYIKDGTYSYINNDQFYNEHKRTEAIAMAANADPNAVNVFIPKDANNDGNTVGVTLGYYTPSRDWLVVRIDQINSQSQTLPHELGHFLSLAHPHVGWECEPFGSDVQGWPKAPTLSPCPPSRPSEYADGSNCKVAGDLLCDTPADYNGLRVNGCVYNLGAQDPTGELIDPNEKLIMAYFSDNCVSEFSEEQKQMIQIDLASARRAKLKLGTWSPPATSVGTNFWINSPTSPVPFSDGKVTLDWADVTGATHYIVELATNRFFSGSEFFSTKGSSIELENISAGQKYSYRIKPYNLAVTCTSFSSTFSFQAAGTSVSSADDISFVRSFSVFPNPAKRDGQVFVSVVSDESFEGDVKVLDLTGKIVYDGTRQFKTGDNEFPIEPNTEMSGVYILYVKTNAGVLKQKFVVSE